MKKTGYEDLRDIAPLWTLAMYQIAQGKEVEKNRTRLVKVERKGEIKGFGALKWPYATKETNRNQDNSIPQVGPLPVL